MDLNTTILSNITNHTSRPPNTMSHDNIVFQACFLGLAFLIVIANLPVLIVYFRTSQLQTNNNIFLISLAFADFFAGALNIPCISLSAFKRGQPGVITFNFIANVLSDFTVTANELNLFLIFLNRYLIISHPLRSRKIINKKRIKRLIASAWSSSLIIALMPITWCYRVVFGLEYTPEYRTSMMARISHHSIAVIVCCFIVPSIIMLFFLISMIYSINEHKKKRERRSSREGSCRATSKSLFRSYIKAFIMLLAMYILMLIAWTPLMVVRLCIDLKIKLDISNWIFHAIMVLRFLTAFINPFIYTFIKREFRHYFSEKIC